jgi:signal transduction histidine kinase
MTLRQKLIFVRDLTRPALRVQLTLLYSGLVLGLLAAALFATNILYHHTAGRAPSGASVVPVAASQSFDGGPALIGLAAAVVALAGAWWLAGRFLRPLQAITTTAQEISATNLHRRLDLRGPSDELTALGQTLDDLFGRLEASFDAQRHFVANASHELRSPLTAERTLLQVALADPKATVETWRQTGEKVLKWSHQQERLVESLLTLATSERGIERWEQFDLGQIAQTVLLGFRQEAERRHIRIDASLAAASASGDPGLVERLAANLIDNALRHNTTGGTIEISTISAPGQATITVSNTGPEVPAAEVERLFHPFRQAGDERVRHTDGHGLGLAIVQAIAQAHGANVTANAHPDGGLEIEVAFGQSDTAG